MKALEIEKGRAGKASNAINISDSYYTGELTAGANQSVDVPDNAHVCIFSANGDFYVSYDEQDAEVPTGTIEAGNVDLNPSVRDVSDLTKLNLIAPATTKITLAFYS